MATALSAGMVGRPKRTPEACARSSPDLTRSRIIALGEDTHHLELRLAAPGSRCPRLAVEDTERHAASRRRQVASITEELAEDATAIGPEHQPHTHQRASGDHARRYRQVSSLATFAEGR